MNSRWQLIASIAGKALLSIQQTSLPQKRARTDQSGTALARGFAVTLIVITSGNGNDLI